MDSSQQETFLPRDVFKHNKDFHGENDWVVYKHKVYDKKIFINTLQALWLERAESPLHTEDVTQTSDDNESTDSDQEDCTADSHESKSLWLNRGIQVFPTTDFCRNLLEVTLRDCCVGLMAKHGGHLYWRDIRVDVKLILDDLIRRSLRGELAKNEAEYMTLLQRWLVLYRENDPPHFQIESATDPNLVPYPLPQLIRENPECLRSWIMSWKPFDLELPVNGAWPTVSEDNVEDVSDSHEVFISSLRSDCDLSPFNTSIETTVAWEVIQEDVLENDILSDNQILVEKQRSQRSYSGSADDRMRKRRMKIMEYFVRRYNLSVDKIKPFQDWATEMQRGHAKLLLLCESQNTTNNIACSMSM